MKFVWILLAVGIVIIAKKVIDKVKTGPGDDENRLEPPIEPIPSQKVVIKPVTPSKSAKVTFLENLNRFKSLLPTLCDGTFKSSDWTDTIIDINNGELTQYWSKAHTSVDAWLRLLASWGLKPDNCTSFKAMEVHKKMYSTKDGADIVLGQSYTVIQKCWVQTDSNNQSKVIVLGKVE